MFMEAPRMALPGESHKHALEPSAESEINALIAGPQHNHFYFRRPLHHLHPHPPFLMPKKHDHESRLWLSMQSPPLLPITIVVIVIPFVITTSNITGQPFSLACLTPSLPIAPTKAGELAPLHPGFVAARALVHCCAVVSRNWGSFQRALELL